MKSPLLPKGTNFTQAHETLVLRIQSIRKKNDQYQRLTAQQIDSSIAEEILDEKSIMDNEIEDTKKMIEEMEYVYKQPPQKNKMKETKKQFEKQNNRYKQISEALMQKSVIKAEMRNSARKSLPSKNRPNEEKMRRVGPARESVEQVAKQQQIDIDYDMEHDIMMSKKKQLGNIEENMQRVYQIHVDQSNMVNEQGNMIDIIGQEMLKAQDNVEQANQELIEASIQQKKSKKKCYIFIFIIILVILLLGGAFFILKPN